MQYGKMIYHHRKKLGWTQEKLCEGICSVSHLSKIENGNKEAARETIELLLKRMKVEKEEDTINLDEIMIQLKRLWNLIERADYQLSKQIFDELILNEELIRYTSISNEFSIVIWRYYIFIEDMQNARKKWKQLEKKRKKFSQHEFVKFLFTLSIFYIKEKRYDDSLLIMDEVQDLVPNIEVEFQEFCFYRALIYQIMNQPSVSMYFCNKAIPIFVQNNNIKRILDSKMLLSLQLIKSKLLDKAELILEEVLDNSTILNDKTIYYNALHNLGYLYFHSNQNKKAITYYQRYLESVQDGSEEYYTVISNIANNMIILKEYQSATELLEDKLTKIEDKNSSLYIKIQVLYFEAKQEKCNLVKYLREVALPYWIKNSESDKLIKYYKILNDFYKENCKIEEQNILLQEYNSILLSILNKKGI
ncbi:helix-turn-helix transcriptional regulator [Bacillus sp. OAE603]|uniref:helix-turn-helix domain-containing protein n=1 Tax=Gottfriedia sp. OAE603 TaxID=2663872 RepID=UPI001789812B